MTRAKYSEDEVRKALGAMDLELYVYKPPDAPGPRQNWKPCDFMVWFPDWRPDYLMDQPGITGAAWIEVKSTPGLNVAGAKLWRPTQLEGMREAARVGIPYLTVVHWPRKKAWTIGTAAIVLTAVDSLRTTGIPFSAFPIECGTGQLAEHLRAALLGEGL